MRTRDSAPVGAPCWVNLTTRFELVTVTAS